MFQICIQWLPSRKRNKQLLWTYITHCVQFMLITIIHGILTCPLISDWQTGWILIWQTWLLEVHKQAFSTLLMVLYQFLNGSICRSPCDIKFTRTKPLNQVMMHTVVMSQWQSKITLTRYTFSNKVASMAINILHEQFNCFHPTHLAKVPSVGHEWLYTENRDHHRKLSKWNVHDHLVL